jgi:hypothetical protein
MIMRAGARLSKFLHHASGFGIGLLLIAVFGNYLLMLGVYLLPTLLAAGLVLRLLEPLARKRGWGSEGRLTRYLSRPRLIDESKRLCIDPGQGL